MFISKFYLIHTYVTIRNFEQLGKILLRYDFGLRNIHCVLYASMPNNRY